MKKIIVALILVVLCCFTACNGGADSNPSNDVETLPADLDIYGYVGEETLRENTFNVAMITKVMPMDETDNTLKTIIDHLHSLHAGMILSAEVAEEDGAQVLDVISERGIPYRFYFDEAHNVLSVKDVANDLVVIQQIEETPEG